MILEVKDWLRLYVGFLNNNNLNKHTRQFWSLTMVIPCIYLVTVYMVTRGREITGKMSCYSLQKNAHFYRSTVLHVLRLICLDWNMLAADMSALF